MSQRICETCGASFDAKPSKILQGKGRYCSRRCYQTAPKAPRAVWVERTCEVCSKTFSIKPCFVRRGDGKFCSRDCRDLARTIPLEVRFQKYLSPPNEKGCVLWTGPKNKAGYGILRNYTDGLHFPRAHRLAWEYTNGPIPDGLEVCHSCDIPACVALAHLFLGTHADNMADMARKGRSARGEQSGLANVTENIVRAIRTRRAEGVSLKQLAEEYKMSQGNVSMIANGRSWAHVT